jgi:para-nitrobenzyl esterase
MNYHYAFLLLFFYSLNINGYDVDSTSGLTIGQNKNGVVHWDDIPYAEPPVGALRWMAPRKAKYQKLLKPKENNFCVQKPSGMGGSTGEGFFSGTEDCLYLDIKAPLNSNSTTKLLPVMFWIHGGGNTSGLKDIYDFSKMVRKHNVVVVTINYRLGPFGWFTHPAIQDKQKGLDKTSNFGTLDIIAALKWLQPNISLFGGDPNNITIFGESAGGHNVLSLLVSELSKDLFHKAIVQSGYTTSISKEDAFIQQKDSSTSNYTSQKVVARILKDASQDVSQNTKATRNILKNISAEKFFSYYALRNSYEEIPLLTADGLVIPNVGLKKALSNKEYLNKVPTIAGSNRDEVKLWLAAAKYFVYLDYSSLGNILGIPKVQIKDKEAFNIFSEYRSRAWKIRGVDDPLRSLHEAGNKDIYAYRFDWDDHRRFFIADFQELIGAAHATEIPLLTGNNKLVDGFGFLLYPTGLSKKFTSKNMMKFWSNFAKHGYPGSSTNGVKWERYDGDTDSSNYMIIDNKKNMKMESDKHTFSSLIQNLYNENLITDLEKCVILLQMLTFVGDDLYDKYHMEFPGECSKSASEKFLKDNSAYIDY